MKRHKEDALERVQRCARAYRDAVENLIATNPTLSESDLDTGEDSYKWLRLPIQDEQPLTVANMILSEYFQMIVLLVFWWQHGEVEAPWPDTWVR